MRIDVKVNKAISSYKLAIKALEKVQKDLIDEMAASGYKNSHFISVLDINPNTYYKKKRNLEFSVDEIKTIVEIIVKNN